MYACVFPGRGGYSKSPPSLECYVTVTDYLTNAYSPWKDTRNREEISEEAYIDLSSLNLATMHTDISMTLHCSAQTARGFFEMGNHRNDLTYGPLMDKWEDEGPYPEESKYVTSTFAPHPLTYE